MPRTLRSKQSFNTGEISPRLYSRTELDQYAKSVRTMTNAIPLPHGPCKRRTGSQYIAEVKDSTSTVKLIPFQFSATDEFVLELGENYMRFYTSKARVESGGSPIELTTPWTASELDELQYIQFGDTLYMVHPDHQPRTLVRNSTLDWVLDTFDPFPAPSEELGYSPGGTVTPAATTGFSVNFTASGSVFLDGDVGRQIINLTDGETGRASIVSITSATVAVCDIVEDFTDTNAISEWKMDLSPVSDLTPNGTKVGSIVNITADIPDSTTAQDTFRSDDIGKYILMHNGVAEIVQINTASDIDVEILKSFDSKDETGNWTLEDETWSSTRGYPRAVGLFDQRLIFGGTTAEPQSLWFSETGLYDGFGIGANDDDSIDVDIVSSAVNQIQWIATGRDLVVGTSGAETTITSSSGIITPSQIQQRPRTYYGSDQQQIATAGSEILFIPKGNRKIRTFVYNFDIDGYKGEDLLLFSEHLTQASGDTIKELAYVQEPDSLIYVVLDSGDMLAGVFSRDQKIIGWSRCTTDGTYENVVGLSDECWVVVNRTIDGNTVRYIEVFDSGDGSTTTDGFSDSFLTYSGGATTSLSGLDHLEGETVQVKVNGAAHPDKTVSSGSITLDISATSATVGLQYTTTIETLDEAFDVGQGPMLGQDVFWSEPILHVYQSSIPTVNGQLRPSRNPSMEMDQPVDLFSGFLKYSRVDSPRLSITSDSPFPLVLTGIFGTVEGNF